MPIPPNHECLLPPRQEFANQPIQSSEYVAKDNLSSANINAALSTALLQMLTNLFPFCIIS